MVSESVIGEPQAIRSAPQAFIFSCTVAKPTLSSPTFPQASWITSAHSDWSSHDSSNLKLLPGCCLGCEKDWTCNKIGRWSYSWVNKCTILLNWNLSVHSLLATPLSSRILVLASPGLLLLQVYGYPLYPRSWRWQKFKASLKASIWENCGCLALFFSAARGVHGSVRVGFVPNPRPTR